MILRLTDYEDGKTVMVNIDNIIRIQEHSARLGKQEKAIIGSRLLSICPQHKGTSSTDPFPVDVRETVDEIFERMRDLS